MKFTKRSFCVLFIIKQTKKKKKEFIFVNVSIIQYKIYFFLRLSFSSLNVLNAILLWYCSKYALCTIEFIVSFIFLVFILHIHSIYGIIYQCGRYLKCNLMVLPLAIKNQQKKNTFVSFERKKLK